MAQTYKIKDVKKGNSWKSTRATSNDDDMQSYALVLEGVGEPVQLNKKLPVKVEPKPGDEVSGTLEEQERNGRIYYKLKVDYSQNQGGGFKGQPKDQKLITAQWAIGQAVQINMALGTCDTNSIEITAKELVSMVNRVKES